MKKADVGAEAELAIDTKQVAASGNAKYSTARPKEDDIYVWAKYPLLLQAKESTASSLSLCPPRVTAIRVPRGISMGGARVQALPAAMEPHHEPRVVQELLLVSTVILGTFIACVTPAGSAERSIQPNTQAATQDSARGEARVSIAPKS
jgi:hypothetical protein